MLNGNLESELANPYPAICPSLQTDELNKQTATDCPSCVWRLRASTITGPMPNGTLSTALTRECSVILTPLISKARMGDDAEICPREQNQELCLS